MSPKYTWVYLDLMAGTSPLFTPHCMFIFSPKSYRLVNFFCTNNSIDSERHCCLSSCSFSYWLAPYQGLSVSLLHIFKTIYGLQHDVHIRQPSCEPTSYWIGMRPLIYLTSCSIHSLKMGASTRGISASSNNTRTPKTTSSSQTISSLTTRLILLRACHFQNRGKATSPTDLRFRQDPRPGLIRSSTQLYPPHSSLILPP